MCQSRESFSFIEKPNGDLSWYKTSVKTGNRLSRAKGFVVGCHLRSQTQRISNWLSNNEQFPSHAVVTRITDDTNVWVDPRDSSAADSGDSDEDTGPAEGDNKRCRTRKAKTKVSPVLGFIQRICSRFPEENLVQSVQVHVPTQVLPKAEIRVFPYHACCMCAPWDLEHPFFSLLEPIEMPTAIVSM